MVDKVSIWVFFLSCGTIYGNGVGVIDGVDVDDTMFLVGAAVKGLKVGSAVGCGVVVVTGQPSMGPDSTHNCRTVWRNGLRYKEHTNDVLWW